MYRQPSIPEGITMEQIRQIHDNTEIVVASSSSYNNTEVSI